MTRPVNQMENRIGGWIGGWIGIFWYVSSVKHAIRAVKNRIPAAMGITAPKIRQAIPKPANR